MGRNRKRVAGRAAKRGDAGNKGDLTQTHTPVAMERPHDTAAGPGISGFFDVSTLRTISMSGERSSDALPGAAPLAAEPAVVDTIANSDRHDMNAVTAHGPSSHGVDVAASAIDHGDSRGGNGAQDETAIEDRTVAPADVPPVQRAYDLFARLRVWSAANASAERSVIVEDPSASGGEPTPDDTHSYSGRGDASNAERHLQRDADPSGERLMGSDHGAVVPTVDVAQGSHTADMPNAGSDSLVNDSRPDASLQDEPVQKDGTEADGSAVPADATVSVNVCARTEAGCMNQCVPNGPTDEDENKNVESNSSGGPNVAEKPYSVAEHTNTTATTALAGTVDTTLCLDDSVATPCIETVSHGGTANAQVAGPRPNGRGRAPTEVTYGTWTPVDEPGWTADVVDALDVHASRAIAGKPSPRIVIFAHGAASSALAAVRRFGPDAIVWVVSSAPDARNIERHGCSVVRWPPRTSAVPGDNLPMRDLVAAVPWDRVDAVIDVGTGRSSAQRAHILKTIVPRMHGGGIYACAVDCRQAALESLRVGAAAIVHEHDHIVVVEPARVCDTRS